MMKRSITFVAPALLLLVGTMDPAVAGKGAFRPTYTPAPCSGDDCRADDPKSGGSCQGFLCSFVSSKAMQPPVTAAQAAEMERARAAAAEAQATQAAAPAPAVKPSMPKARTKHLAKAKAPPKPATAANVPPTTAAPTAPASQTK